MPTDPTGTVPPMDDPSMRSASLSPEEERVLRAVPSPFWTVDEWKGIVARLLATLDAERMRWAERLDAARTPRETPDPDPMLALIRRRAERGVTWEPGSVPRNVSEAVADAFHDRRYLLGLLDD